ncbi:hypothetical protein COV15_02430 [Candidatus Woesearchaeota archaeon CG10_big_fil_rev_8_21_14_0_10_34_12]|nr:MAG: hypothetical protein COV15_02430 [Candidatus Woesearchaeota archaeon CG10_big_fil_rev_8_21_14_0_10_34_12]
MGFLDFLRKKINEAKEIIREQTTDNISNKEKKFAVDFKIEDLNKLESWVKNKKTNLENQEKEFLEKIKEKILLLIKELKEKTEIAKKIDVGGRKVEEKIKLVVQENLYNYLRHIEKLVESLESFEANDTRKTVEKLDNILLNFDKQSRMSYEKSTILIGKELGSMRESIRKFLGDIHNISNENRSFIKEHDTIKFIESKIKEISNIENLNSDLFSEINKMGAEIKALEKEAENIFEKIEQEKKSDSHISFIEKRNGLESKNRELENKTSELRHLADFKKLFSIFHSDAKKMESVKKYEEDFQESFKEDKGKLLLELFKEANLNSQKIIGKIEEINTMKDKIAKIIIPEDIVKSLELEKKNILSRIEALKYEKDAEKKRHDKIENSRKEAIEEIKKRFE